MFMNTQVIWSPGVSLETMERNIIVKAYRFYKENKTAAAASLGICVRTLANKLEKYEEEERVVRENAERQKEERKAFLARCRGQNSAGVREQPAIEVAEKLEMPMPEREEVQIMLHEQVTTLGAKKTGVRTAKANVSP